jgi:hypothetical protein
MGKTALADLVYQEIGHEFQCRAFVSLSKSPDMLEVLRAVLCQVTEGVLQSSDTRSTTEAATEENLSNEISNFLSDKRYANLQISHYVLFIRQCMKILIPFNPSKQACALAPNRKVKKPSICIHFKGQ